MGPKILVVFHLFLIYQIRAQYMLSLLEGQPCDRTGTWTCKSVNNCRHVNVKVTRPQICSFKGTEPIICCKPPPTSAVRPSEQMCGRFIERTCYYFPRVTRRVDIYRDLWPLIEGGKKSLPRTQPHMSLNINPLESSWRLPWLQNWNVRRKRHYLLGRRLVGGTAAKSRDHIHSVLVGYGNRNSIQWRCGGSLISYNFVLSAAHCSQSNIGPARWARVGELDLSSTTDDARPQDREITSRINHPRYKPPEIYNDIALYKLDRPVQFTAWVAPACLHGSTALPYEKATVTGWGRLELSAAESPTLQEVDITLVEGNECRRLFGGEGTSTTPRGVDPITMICAGEKEGGKDACLGDSGGPMVIEVPGRCLKTQIAITSYGKDCGLPNTPALYTRVSFYLDWIESIVWP